MSEQQKAKVETKVETKVEAKVEKKAVKQIVVGKVFGTAVEGKTHAIMVGKTKTDGEVTGAKYLFHLPLQTPDQPGVTPEIVAYYFQFGALNKAQDTAASTFNSKNGYGDDAAAEAFFKKFTTSEGLAEAMVRTKVERTGAAKLDDAETMAVKILVKALAKQALGDKVSEATKEQKASWRTKALEWKAAGHKNWQAAYKKAQAAQAVDLVD